MLLIQNDLLIFINTPCREIQLQFPSQILFVIDPSDLSSAIFSHLLLPRVVHPPLQPQFP